MKRSMNMGRMGTKSLSVLFVCIIMICFVIAPAFAENAVFKTTKSFLDYLDANNVKYENAGLMDDDTYELIKVSSRLDNFSPLTCQVWFKRDNNQVSLRIFDIVTATAGKNYVLTTLNSLNASYKFGKFVYDENDSTVQLEMDMYIDPDHCARSVFDAVLVLFQIVDENEIAQKLHSLE